jgi:hypothetical protein
MGVDSYEAMGDTLSRDTVPVPCRLLLYLYYGLWSIVIVIVIGVVVCTSSACGGSSVSVHLRSHRHNPSHWRTENVRKVLRSRLPDLSSMSAQLTDRRIKLLFFMEFYGQTFL